MSQRNILIFAVDGLRASALGAYGNTSFGTPSLDHFAADSFTLDWCYSAGAELVDVYRALWQSQHPLRSTLASNCVFSLAKIISGAGLHTTLVTDETELKSLPGAADFDQIIEIGQSEERNELRDRARDVAETSMAQLFAATCDLVESGVESGGRLVWVHSRGMYGPWDAPLEFQQSLRDESDPPPVGDVVPPDLVVTARDDPDVVFRYSAAYAGQVMALDACWRGLMQAIAHTGTNDWLVVLLGARGFPLGEHARIGGVDKRLFAEQLHVPALLRFPTGFGRLARTAALTSHVDLLPTLLHWLNIEPHEDAPRLDGMSWHLLAETARTAWRDALTFTSRAGNRAIRTADWCLRQDLAEQAPFAILSRSGVKSELFVRPDDRWEANDVAKLCPDVVETLTHVLDNVSGHFTQNEPIQARVLPEEMSSCS